MSFSLIRLESYLDGLMKLRLHLHILPHILRDIVVILNPARHKRLLVVGSLQKHHEILLRAVEVSDDSFAFLSDLLEGMLAEFKVGVLDKLPLGVEDVGGVVGNRLVDILPLVRT